MKCNGCGRYEMPTESFIGDVYCPDCIDKKTNRMESNNKIYTDWEIVIERSVRAKLWLRWMCESCEYNRENILIGEHCSPCLESFAGALRDVIEEKFTLNYKPIGRESKANEPNVLEAIGSICGVCRRRTGYEKAMLCDKCRGEHGPRL